MKAYAGEGTLSEFARIVKEAIADAGGGTDFTPDDTLTLTDGTLGVATPVQGVYTQADYDALPEAQKNNGLYVISDDGGGAEGGSSGEIYSTEETRIGTWIDGKPLYRKTFETFSGYSATIQFDSSFTIRDIRGIIYTRNNTNVPINCFYDSSFYSVAWQNLYPEVSAGNIEIRTVGNAWTNCPMIVSVEYTKNTDSSTIQKVTE